MTAAAKKLIKRAKPRRPVPGQMATQPTSTLRVFVSGLAHLGYDTASLLSAAGVTAAQLEDPEGRVPCMSLPAETPIGAFQLLDYLIVTCENVSQGMRQLARYLRLGEAPFSVEIRDAEDPIHLVYVGIPDSFVAEFEIALAIFHLRRETDSRLRPEYVGFTHTPGDVREAERLLGCPVRSQAPWLGIAFSRQSWELPLRRRDAVLQSVLLRNAEDVAARLPKTNDVVTDLRRILITRLAQGNADIESVAPSTATSVRSLQRRLAAAGTTYQELLDATRREAAGRYLADRALSIAEVGYLLGYSEPAAFHRAFQRWHGSTPQEFRFSSSSAG